MRVLRGAKPLVKNPAIIALLTDFGLRDGNVGVMKGVILSIAPQARLIDLSHEIEPQDVRQGAIVLGRSAPYFPDGSIFLSVVDPGVGTARRPMAARLGGQTFVGPDNGLATRLIERAERLGRTTSFVHLDRPQFWLPEVSHVFHGRDVFAPVAAHLAGGVPLEDLGSSMTDPVRLPLPAPTPFPGGWRGEVEYIDRFGNLRTNLRREDVGEDRASIVRVAGIEVRGLARTFGEHPPGELVALFGSTGELILAVVNGSAATHLGAKVGDVVEVIRA